MDSSIISQSSKPEILALLHQGKFEDVLSKLSPQFAKCRWLSKVISKVLPAKQLPFAYPVLLHCLMGRLKPEEYSNIACLNFKGEFLNELIELFRILLTLQDYSLASDKEYLIAATLLEGIRDGAGYIAKHSNNYPQNSINGKVWMDGAGLRTRADELATYFLTKQDDHKALEPIYLRAKLTTTIMSHYPNFVGPDMIAVAQQYEKMGQMENAKRFYIPVVSDFTSLVQEVEEKLADPEFEVSEEDFPITQALIDALEGLKRLGEAINDQTLWSAQYVLNEIKKAISVNQANHQPPKHED